MSALIALELGRILIVLYLLWHWTYTVSSEGPPSKKVTSYDNPGVLKIFPYPDPHRMGKKILLKFECTCLSGTANIMIYINVIRLRINLHVIYPNLFVIFVNIKSHYKYPPLNCSFVVCISLKRRATTVCMYLPMNFMLI